MAHDPRLVQDDDVIEKLRKTIPDWITRLERPATPCVVPRFGPLEGVRAVGTGVFVAQPYIGTKLAEFGAEVIHIERPGGDSFRFTAPQLARGPRPHGCDEAEVTKNKLSMGSRPPATARDRTADGVVEDLRRLDGSVRSWHA